jgi:protein-S-isoprenylcysteine O-methyltransferase Ste14
MSAAYLVLVILCLVGLAIRTGYELLKKAGRVDPHNKLVFGVVFAAMCVMLLSWPLLGPLDPLPLALPGAVRGVGLVLLAVGPGLAVGGIIQLKGVENIDHLVTAGLFSRLRHPMYTGFVLWIAGWVIFHGAAASLVAGLVCIANILYWRRLEENNLASQFGEDYHRYRMTTWF